MQLPCLIRRLVGRISKELLPDLAEQLQFAQQHAQQPPAATGRATLRREMCPTRAAARGLDPPGSPRRGAGHAGTGLKRLSISGEGALASWETLFATVSKLRNKGALPEIRGAGLL